MYMSIAVLCNGVRDQPKVYIGVLNSGAPKKAKQLKVIFLSSSEVMVETSA